MDQAREHQGNQSTNDSNDNEKNNDSTEKITNTDSANDIPTMFIDLPKPVLILDPEEKYHASKSVTQE
ncbi:unnamed protein product [Adineta steineri]|uniref:Uncharacterized protein n=1 Tax=Adineta steineri TaxID=433720 RepID=A0A820CFL9_9BILA|nr:unnamed protein product [Adineta steineri]CAF4216855.1 unnamed protein product [Adineta steineri]